MRTNKVFSIKHTTTQTATHIATQGEATEELRANKVSSIFKNQLYAYSLFFILKGREITGRRPQKCGLHVIQNMTIQTT